MVKIDKFSSRLSVLRKTVNMTQSDLAEELGFSRTTIANYEQGTRLPSVETLCRIADFFGVTTDYLLGRTDLASSTRFWFQESRNIILSINTSDGQIRDCSLGALTFYGYHKKDLLKKTIYEISSFSPRNLLAFLKNNVRYSFKDRHRTAEGRLINVRVITGTMSREILIVLVLPENLNIIKSPVSVKYLQRNLSRITKSDFNKALADNIYIKNDNIINVVKENYFRYLLEGNKTKALTAVISGIRSNLTIEDIYLKVLEPSLVRIGEMWERQQLTVDEEHLFSSASRQILIQLHNYFPVPAVNHGYKAAAVTATGELHDIGLMMVADFLELNGWETYFLGSNLPARGILHAIEKYQVDLLLISAALSGHINSAANMIQLIKAEKETVKIMVGGRAFNKNNKLWKELNADGYARNAGKAVEAALKLMKR